MAISRVLSRLNHPFGERQTVGGVLARNRGIGPGFDLLRMALAVAIFVGHVKWLSGSPPSATVSALADGTLHLPGFGRLKLLLLPMFFALSGILVMGSAARIRSASTFLAHRVFRIFPALVVEVLLSAFVLGPLLTVAPLHDYFGSPQFVRYLGNCLGVISFDLPGVFTTNAVTSTVNVNLWTLPSELHCYIVTVALMVTGVLFRRRLLSAVFLVATAVLLAYAYAFDAGSTPDKYLVQVIVYYFAAGAMVYEWRDHIPVRTDLALLVAIVGGVTFMFDGLRYVSPIFVTMTVMYVGLIPFPRIPALSGGDYSYGIYLYGFPISQAALKVFPALEGRMGALLLVAGLATLAFAMASWHLVEKRTLALRRHLPKSLFPTTARSPDAGRGASPMASLAEAGRV